MCYICIYIYIPYFQNENKVKSEICMFHFSVYVSFLDIYIYVYICHRTSYTSLCFLAEPSSDILKEFTVTLGQTTTTQDMLVSGLNTTTTTTQDMLVSGEERTSQTLVWPLRGGSER